MPSNQYYRVSSAEKRWGLLSRERKAYSEWQNFFVQQYVFAPVLTSDTDVVKKQSFLFHYFI
jgi:hypothetical protein